MTIAANNERLVEQGDLDELVRQIDRLSDAQEWDGLFDLRDRCRAALTRGKQLWPAASLAEYRVALDAPGHLAGRVVEPGAGNMALGPLPEVAASTHAWATLASSIPDGPLATITAHECVVRGEDLTGDERIDVQVLDLPLALQDWEPRYPLAEYEPSEARFPPPPLPARHDHPMGTSTAPLADTAGTNALLDLTGAWTAESNGRAEAVAVDGDAFDAIATLGPPHVRVADLDPATALAWMAWAAASGGAHGRRRGMAAGRFGAWWTVAALAGLSDEWPLESAELGQLAGEMRWYAWDAWEPETGWRFHLAVDDPSEGLAWAIASTDAA
jgi:hypothetical protein